MQKPNLLKSKTLKVKSAEENENRLLPRKILLVGNPNSGKTTLFNQLTGLNQKIANYPGVTVESKSGKFSLIDPSNRIKTEIELIDLPGIYSLNAISEDEKQAVVPIFQFAKAGDKEDILVIFVVDTNNPARSLHLYLAVRNLGFKTLLLMNMAPMAAEKGIFPNIESIQQDLGPVPVVISSKSRGKTAGLIREAVRKFPSIPIPVEHNSVDHSVFNNQGVELEKQWFTIKEPSQKSARQKMADRIFMHPVWGPICFLTLLLLVFQSLFTFSAYPTDWIEGGMDKLTRFLSGVLSDNLLSQLVLEGVLPGLTGIFVFIPQIAFLFMFIAIMEESGYLSRATFLADNLMRRFGLNGKSLIPFAGGAACAVPAILSARTISNPRERLLTILVTPWVTCSARLPVFVTLIAVFVPEGNTGWVSTRGLVLGVFYLLGVVAVFSGAWLLNLFFKPEKSPSLFMMELPDYRAPQVKTVIKTMLERVGDFVWNAGKIILAISVVLWVLASFGPPSEMKKINEKYAVQSVENPENLPLGYKAEKLEASFAGKFGKIMEPVLKPLGFDWKIGIGLLTSFAAREVFVGTMNTIYGLGNDADSDKLSEIMASEKRPDGSKRFDAATSLSLMVFFLLAMQCMSTFAVVKKETRSLKLALLQLFLMTGIAYVASFAVYQTLSI